MWQRSIILALFLFLFYPMAAKAQEQEANTETSQYTISIIVFGQGDDLFSRFGHIGIMVENPTNYGSTKSMIYNYGTFSFADRGLWAKYAMGYLMYWLSYVPFRYMIHYYELEDRQIDRYTLNLNQDEATQVALFLKNNARYENRYFFYRHYLDNCCTRIRDIINTLMAGQLKATAEKQPAQTYRFWTRDCLKNRPILGFLIDYVLGREIDRPISRWDAYFLPKVFAEDLIKAQLPDGRPLVKDRIELHKRVSPQPSASWPLFELIIFWTLVALITLGGIVPVLAGPKKWSQKLFSLGLFIWGLLPGLGGLILFGFLFTAHLDTHWNENILVTPLSHLLLLWGAFGILLSKENAARRCQIIQKYLMGASALLLLLLCLKFGPLFQTNYGIIAAMLCGNLWLALVAIPRLKLTAGVKNGK